MSDKRANEGESLLSRFTMTETVFLGHTSYIQKLMAVISRGCKGQAWAWAVLQKKIEKKIK